MASLLLYAVDILLFKCIATRVGALLLLLAERFV